MNTKTAIFSAVLAVGLIVGLAAGSATITYQARVKTAAGTDINGPVTVGFRIYGTPSGSTVLWGETQSLTATKGIISVELGKVNPLPAGLFNNPELYLGLTVAGDPEMAPRTRLLSTWKAMSASRASGKVVQAGGGTAVVSNAASVSVAVTFPKAFASAPVVMAGALDAPIGGKAFILGQVSDLTAAGCTVTFVSLDGSSATGAANFDWIAVGE